MTFCKTFVLTTVDYEILSTGTQYSVLSTVHFKKEITVIGNCSEDGNIRPKSSQETLDGLKLAFDQNGTVTAATSSPLTDGAAATLICDEQFARANNLEILEGRVKTLHPKIYAGILNKRNSKKKESPNNCRWNRIVF